MRRNYPPRLREQEVVPYFQLPSSCETWVSAWDYKQKKNLVIFFFHSEACPQCRRILAQFAAQYAQFKEVDTEVLAISIISVIGAQQLVQELNLPFLVLADDTGRVSEQYTHIDPATRTPVPTVLVVDRFGALYSQTISENENDLPTPDEIMDWLDLIEVQCPECGVSEWSMVGRDWPET